MIAAAGRNPITPGSPIFTQLERLISGTLKGKHDAIVATDGFS
jgi:hypothetical protein